MTAVILKFPERGPFAVHVAREDHAFVLCRAHGWLFGSRSAAMSEATAIARAFGVAIKEEISP
jgi:hypothetical protein